MPLGAFKGTTLVQVTDTVQAVTGGHELKDVHGVHGSLSPVGEAFVSSTMTYHQRR